MREPAVRSTRNSFWFLMVLVVTPFVLTAIPITARGSEQESAPKVADFSVKDLSGETVDLSNLLKQGPVVIAFWMSYCKTCKNELSEFDKLQRKYGDRGFSAVAVCEDAPKTVQKAKALLSQKKWAMSVILDTNKDLGNLYGVRYLPTFYLIAQDGTIDYFAAGYLPGDKKALEDRILKLLANGADSTSAPTYRTSTP